MDLKQFNTIKDTILAKLKNETAEKLESGVVKHVDTMPVLYTKEDEALLSMALHEFVLDHPNLMYRVDKYSFEWLKSGVFLLYGEVFNKEDADKYDSRDYVKVVMHYPELMTCNSDSDDPENQFMRALYTGIFRVKHDLYPFAYISTITEVCPQQNLDRLERYVTNEKLKVKIFRRDMKTKQYVDFYIYKEMFEALREHLDIESRRFSMHLVR
jgi:hypothetical protein